MYQNLIVNLLELRKRLIYALIGFIGIFAILFHFSNEIYKFFAKPLFIYFPSGSQLIATDITSPFWVPLKLTAILAFLLSLPNIVYQLWKFIAPGLYKTEKQLIFYIIISVIILFILGSFFCYSIVLPVLFHFITIIKPKEVIMFTDISKYLNFILDFFVIFGLCFQMPIVVFLLVKCKIVSRIRMIQLRPYVFVGVFILGAILTPPDILSQTLLALPLYILYELGLFITKFFKADNKC